MSLDLDARCTRLAGAAATFLADGDRRRACRAGLVERHGWSAPMAAWILDATFRPLAEHAQLARWAARGRATGAYAGATVVVAGGAIPDPAVRAVAAAFLLGGRLAVKPCARERVVLEAFVAALDSDIALYPHAGGADPAAERSFYAAADRIIAFGRDPALTAIRALARPGVVFHAHGPRFSFAVVRGQPRADEIRGLAVDIARYDQRGCLSPQLVIVEGDRGRALVVAAQLAAALAACERELPAGRSVEADEVAWRLRLDDLGLEHVARGGELATFGDDRAFLVHEATAPHLELSVGGRVAAVAHLGEIRTGLAHFLGAAAERVQGVAILGGDPAAWQGVSGASRVVAAGYLQLPELEFAPDGLDPFAIGGEGSG